MSQNVADPGPTPPRRSLSGRLDSVGKRVMALVAGIGLLASTFASVRALLPEGSKPSAPHAAVSHLKPDFDVPLREFVARDAPVALAQPRSLARGAMAAKGTVLVASRGPTLVATDLAQTGPSPPPDGGGGQVAPPGSGDSPAGESDPGGAPSTSQENPPSTSQENPPSTSQENPPSTSQENTDTGTGTSTTPGPDPPAATSQARRSIAVRSEDLRKSVKELKRESRRLKRRIKRKYALSRSCRRQPPRKDCPLATGMHVRFPRGTKASPATKAEAEKLALIGLELNQLKRIKSTKGPGGKRDPLGVELAYRVVLCGYGSRSIHVHWTVRDHNRPRRAPEVWWMRRPANAFSPDTTRCKRFFPTFWVPLPAAKGRFSVELTVWDEDGSRQAPPKETRPFHS